MKHLLYLLCFVISTSYAQVYQPVTYHFNGTPANGVKIKTNIPFTPSSHMPTIIIEGYNYGTSDAIGIMINYYLWSATPADTSTYYFVKHNATSYGGYTPVIKLAKENNKVVIYIDSKDYCIRFMVRAFSKGLAEQASWFEGWTVADEALTGTSQVTVQYRNRFKNDVLIDGRVAVRSGSLGGISFTNTANYYVNSINSITGSDSTQAHLAFRVGTANAVMNNLPERMRIDKDGNIGIGTTTPISKLDVNGVLTLRSGSVFVNSITPAVSVNGSSQTMRFGYNSSTTTEGFQFYNSNTSANLMMIQGGGNVGIGTYTPTAPLHVEKGVAGNYIAYFKNSDNGISSNGLRVDVENNSSNNTAQRWYAAGTEIMRVQANGNVGIGISVPVTKLHIATNATSISAVQTIETIGAGGRPYTLYKAESTNYGYVGYGINSSDVMSVFNYKNAALQFGTNSTPRMSITGDGKVGIGTIVPAYKLDVNGDIRINKGGVLRFFRPDSTTNSLNIYSGAANNILHSQNGGLILAGASVIALDATTGHHFRNSDGTISHMTISSSGNVGIGVSSPTKRLELGGSRPMSLDPANGSIKIKASAGGWAMNYGFKGSGDTDWGGLWAYGTDDALTHWSIGKAYTDNFLIVKNNGQIGIGTTSIPTDYKLAIGGNVIAEKVKVKKRVGGVWPDYVFSPDYKLPSLEDVEEFTKKNSHLPEIPSAKEIEKEGQDLGDMNRLLLKKVEELTLYLIKERKANIEQNEQLKDLRKEILELRELIK